MANQLKIVIENDSILTESVIPGIDKNNVLASSSGSFTAPADGIVVFSATNSNSGAWASVDGVTVMNSSGQDRWFNHMTNFPVKKGQVCSVGAGYGTPSAVLYGLKR